MTTLTEQWKKGELPDGWYYVKGNRAEGIYAYTAEYLNNMYRPRNGEIIIEQVPSYEQWQEYKEANDSMFDTIKMLNKDNYKLEEENTKLKELLRELKRYFDADGKYYIEKRILLEINQVLGEE